MSFEEFTHCDSYPSDGKYLCRLDEDDDAEDVMVIEVKDGKAFKDGKRKIIFGFEWKSI